jgi:hypothetical protein
MPSVLFWTCEACGIDWRADLDADDTRSINICKCGDRHEVSGTVISLHCAPRARSGNSKAIVLNEGLAVKNSIQIYAAQHRVDRSQDSD